MAGYNDFGYGGHAYSISSDNPDPVVFCRCLERGTRRPGIYTSVTEYLIFSAFFCQPDDSGTISIGHAGEAGPELVDVFPSQRMFREEIDMVGDDHQVAHQKLSVDTTGSIGNEEILHA